MYGVFAIWNSTVEWMASSTQTCTDRVHHLPRQIQYYRERSRGLARIEVNLHGSSLMTVPNEFRPKRTRAFSYTLLFVPLIFVSNLPEILYSTYNNRKKYIYVYEIYKVSLLTWAFRFLEIQEKMVSTKIVGFLGGCLVLNIVLLKVEVFLRFRGYLVKKFLE